MKRINLTPYDAGMNEPFNVKESLINILFFQVNDPRELLAREELAKKIESTPDKEDLLLENTDWQKCVKGITDSMKARVIDTNRIQVEFVRRIINAPDVDTTKLKAV